MIYNFNHGLGWASSGVEYAQKYRANMLRRAGLKAKFVYTDMFTNDNISDLARNLGFFDEEIIWLYGAFTDVKVAPSSYTLDEFEKTFDEMHFTYQRAGKTAKYYFDNDTYYSVNLKNGASDIINSVEYVSKNNLIKRDFYTYCKTFSEFYAPLDKKAHLYSRRFYNEDGSVAYEECIDGDRIFYRFDGQVLYSKQELIGYYVKSLNLTKEDTVIIDRTTNIGQAIMQNVGDARVGMIVHADHFSENNSTDEYILWNNYYEYAFSLPEVDFYITATDSQNELIRKQFVMMGKEEPNVVTIPVGSLDSLKKPSFSRKPLSVITASRLASEKHCDWIVEAVAKVHEQLPDITLDIYGKGPEEAKIRKTIEDTKSQDYVRLMGQQKLDDVYVKYQAYLSASQSEGFGLTLMEAIGSGLPIVGFDVRYGNKNFIDEGLNGYKIPINDEMDKTEKVALLAEKLLKMFSEDDATAFSEHSYEKAKEYLTSEVENRWIKLLTE